VVLAGTPPLELTIEKRGIKQRCRKKKFPIWWYKLEPFEIPRKVSFKELERMLDVKVMEAWDRMFRSEVDDNHWCRILIPSLKADSVNLANRPNFLLSQAIYTYIR